VQNDVRVLFDHDLVAGLGERTQRHLVAHRAARDEQRGFLAEERRDAFLEGVHRRVLAENVVADLGVGHGSAHLRRRFRERVGTQFYPVVLHGWGSLPGARIHSGP
jgi:hypothetical protein